MDRIYKTVETFIVNQYDDHSCLKLNMEQLILKMNETITQVAAMAKKLLVETTHKMYRRENRIRMSARLSCTKAVHECRSALRLENDLSAGVLSAKHQLQEHEARACYEVEMENTRALMDRILEQKLTNENTIIDLCKKNIQVEHELAKVTTELDEERELNAKKKEEFRQEIARLKNKEVDDVFKIISLRKAVKDSQILLTSKSHKIDYIQRQSSELEQKLHVSHEIRHKLEKKYHDSRSKLKLYEEGQLCRLLPLRRNTNFHGHIMSNKSMMLL